MNLRILIISLGLFFNAGIALAQIGELAKIVRKIKGVNEVHYQSVGAWGMDGENYLNFLELKKIATNNDLIRLSQNRNQVVVCYASWALADTHYEGLASIFSNLVKENASVNFYQCCIRGKDNVSSMVYHRYWNTLENRTSDPLLKQMDSLILYSKNSDPLLVSRALENRMYKDPIITQIASLAFEKGDTYALIYLCKWHKADYPSLLKKALLKCLKETSFADKGSSLYFDITEQVLGYDDQELLEALIEKMKNDRTWESSKSKFKDLFQEEGINNFNFD